MGSVIVLGGRVVGDQKPTVLMIDDEQFDAELLERILVRVPDWQAQVVHYEDPQAALEALPGLDIDAIFLDYHIGNVDGLSVLKSIRALNFIKPVIVLTGQGSESIALEVMRAGADDYLLKGLLTPEAVSRVIKHAQAQYFHRQTEATNDALLKAIPDLMLRIRRDGVLLDARPGDDVGLTLVPEQCLGRHVRDVLPEAFADLTMQHVDQVMTSGQARSFEYRLLDGRDQRYFEVRVANCSRDQVVALIRNITERRLAEEMILKQGEDLAFVKDELEDQAGVLILRSEELEKAHAKAEAAVHSKSEFLANMSHEIRTPMTAILGYTDLLTEPGISAGDLKNYVATIRRNGEHLLTIINDILDMSKIESGKMTIEKIECSPGQILSDVLSLLMERAKSKGLALKAELDGPIPKVIETDPTRLRQILINLVGNAIKFTDQGCIRVVVRLIDSPDGPDSSLSFDVIDTGIGMTEDQVATMFEAFLQADTTTTRKYGGTGLGLMISKRFANMLGGDLSASCESGRGCSFTATVAAGPLAGVEMIDSLDSIGVDATMDKPSVPGSSAATSVSANVLLAEDSPDNQRLIRFVLRKAGMSVDVADNGLVAYEKALEAWRNGTPFDIVLMDMQMPEMDGYEATRNLRQEGYRGHIVALTAHAMSSDRDKCLAAGCDDYATKPINKDQLIKMIKRQVDAVGHDNCESNSVAG